MHRVRSLLAPGGAAPNLMSANPRAHARGYLLVRLPALHRPNQPQISASTLGVYITGKQILERRLHVP
jgi:hypothetical protein